MGHSYSFEAGYACEVQHPIGSLPLDALRAALFVPSPLAGHRRRSPATRQPGSVNWLPSGAWSRFRRWGLVEPQRVLVWFRHDALGRRPGLGTEFRHRAPGVSRAPDCPHEGGSGRDSQADSQLHKFGQTTSDSGGRLPVNLHRARTVADVNLRQNRGLQNRGGSPSSGHGKSVRHAS